MAEADLFDLPDPSRRLTDPRNHPVNMPKEGDVQARRLNSVDEMMTIFREEIAKETPSAAQCEEFERSGNRYRIEEGRFVVEGFVTRVTPGAFRRMVKQGLEKTNEGTFLHTLHRTQGNGVWVPTKCAIRPAVHPMNDRKVPLARERFGGEMEPIEVGGASATMLPVPSDVLEYRIVWTDAAGAEDIKYDARGNVVIDQNVRVQQGTDPALAAALDRLADSLAPTPPTKPAK